MKKVFVIAIFVLLVYTPLISQHWRNTDYHTPEGFAMLKQQDDTSYTLSIDERLEFYKTGVAAASYHRDSLWIRKFAYKVASTANALDAVNTALEYIAIARKAIDKENDFAIDIISYQGVLHKQAGDYEQALAYYEEALQLAREKFPDKVVMPLSNIATLYRSQKDYLKTLEYLYQLNTIARGLESPHQEYHLVYNYAESCIAHKHLNHLDSAAYYGRLCIQNLDRLDKQLNMKTAGFAYITVAELYIEKLQRPELAKPLLDSALLYVEGLYLDKVKVSLGKYYLATNAPAKADQLIQELQQADIQSETTRLRALELTEQYYTTIGDFEKALAAAKDIKALEEERFNKEKTNLTTFYAAKFEHQKQQEEIKKLAYEQYLKQEKYRTRSLTLVLISLLSIGLALFLRRQLRRKKKFADILQREVARKTQDLKMVNAALADKVEKLNTFNYTVSHDLKTPLSSAFNFVDLIKLHIWEVLNPNTQQLFDNLLGVLTHMKEMINGVSLYLMADRMDLQPELVSTESIIHDILTHLKHQFPDQLKHYNFIIPSPLPDYWVDPLLFRQLMTNILYNAIKAARLTKRPEIQVTGQKTAQAIILKVRDNGIGIPFQQRDRIFEIFKSVHSQQQFPGTGVGLAIAKRIVERHGGTIDVESDGEGKGATFFLSFPSLMTTH